MSVHMNTRPIKNSQDFVSMQYAGAVYQFPTKVAEKYRVQRDTISPEEFFAAINKKYTKAGVLLQGVRAREGFTQIQMAKKLNVTQSDISQMENGKRKIGRKMALRIQKLFDVNYESFLSTEK
jgi:plasmid maintenance system antidote protein VapI